MQDKIGVKLYENLHSLKEILISFHIFFSMKKFVWFVILKFTMSGFPLKIVNLPFQIDLETCSNFYCDSLLG